MEKINTSYCAWLVKYEEGREMTDTARAIKSAVFDIFFSLDLAAEDNDPQTFERIEALAAFCAREMRKAEQSKGV